MSYSLKRVSSLQIKGILTMYPQHAALYFLLKPHTGHALLLLLRYID